MAGSSSITRRALTLAVGIAIASHIAVSAPASAEPSIPVQPALPFPHFPLPPELDPGFYEPPADVVASKAPGELIAARQVTLANLSLIPANVDAWQLSFRSNNTRGEAIPSVATVIKPRGNGTGPRNLLSFQPAEDSLGHYCTASYALQQGSIPGLITGQQVLAAQFLEIQAAVAQGWAVVVPDHQGPDSAYAAGPLAGRITLDGIRAAENFDLLGLAGRDTQVAMLGYSGGAIATGHAAELHESYAPELNIVGAAEGGIPADITAMLNLANNNAASGLIMGGMIGVSREYPELAALMNAKLDPLGKALVAAKNPLCVAYQAALLPFGNLKGMFETPGDPLDDPIAKSVLDKIKMGKSVPQFPMYMYQANPDWIVPVGPVNTLVDTYCQDPNAKVQYTRDHFSEHLTLEIAAVPSAMLWIRDRFAGVPVAAGCTTTDVGSMALDERTWPVWQSVVGDLVAGLFGKPIGS
ncbi:lipase family protein [Antrihabitans sp. NCIMB 15449]|uniref:Lipase family protein n=1 Tax=Antrihabitans spumae TaxID=3373370 RepID=A0ABW7JI17_9NOCA